MFSIELAWTNLHKKYDELLDQEEGKLFTKLAFETNRKLVKKR
jgi:hypothetical protein